MNYLKPRKLYEKIFGTTHIPRIYKILLIVLAMLLLTSFSVMGYMITLYRSTLPAGPVLDQTILIGANHNPLHDGLDDLTFEQKEHLIATLKENGVTDIINICKDESLKGTYSSKNSSGKEEGYRIATSSEDVLLFVKDGEPVGIRYAAEDGYGHCINLLPTENPDLTDDKRVAIVNEVKKYVKDTLPVDSLASFPVQVTKSNDWEVWKEGSAIYVQSYVDAKLESGITKRDYFKIKVINKEIVSFTVAYTETM